MPDLLTHATVAYIGSQRFRRHLRPEIVCLGAAWPDVFVRSINTFFYDVSPFMHSLHTPISLLLQCGALSLLFSPKIRMNIFTCLVTGVITHLALDAIQMYPRGWGYLWFFPFSTKSFEIPLFGSSDWPYLAALSAGILLAYELVKRFRRGTRKS